MKVLIEIDKRDYELMKARTCKSSSDFIILHGKPLPIGHDDLIDRTELFKAMDTWPKFGYTADGRLVPCDDNLVPYVHYADMVQAVKGMPTIIEADKAGKEKDEQAQQKKTDA